MLQVTLKSQCSFSGVGVHTGTSSTVLLRPAEPNTGIVFCRTDLPDKPMIPAVADNVSRTDRCTVIGSGQATVSTIEHLMSALFAKGIDNCHVDIDGPEVPIADGSAVLFCQLIDEAGQIVQNVPRNCVFPRSPIWVRDGNKTLVALPYDGFRISFTFTNDHAHPKLSDMHTDFDMSVETYETQIAPARTMGWLKEIEALKARGLALGATEDMAIVLSDDDILTRLRFDDELVRHKVLDLIGDLFLAGRINAHVIAIRSGHALNNRLARALLSAADAGES